MRMMIPFHPSQPFPPLEPDSQSVADAQAHAAAADRWLGLRTQDVERILREKGSRRPAPESSGEKQELWFGLDVKSLLTPYCEIRALLDRLAPRPGQTIVDLGAAYGRMAFVIARHFPGVRFRGYEYVGERVDEGRRAIARAGIRDVRLDHADLAVTTPEAADFYFIYDFGTPKTIEKALYDIRRHAEQRAPVVIARGRHCRALIDARHPWLSGAPELLKSWPESRVSVYRSIVQLDRSACAEPRRDSPDRSRS